MLKKTRLWTTIIDLNSFWIKWASPKTVWHYTGVTPKGRMFRADHLFSLSRFYLRNFGDHRAYMYNIHIGRLKISWLRLKK